MTRRTYQISNVANRPRTFDIDAIPGEIFPLVIDWRAFLSGENVIQGFSTQVQPQSALSATVPAYDPLTQTAAIIAPTARRNVVQFTVQIGVPDESPEQFIVQVIIHCDSDTFVTQ